MGKIGDQRHNYSATLKPQASSKMDRFLSRPTSTASGALEDTQTTSEQSKLNTGGWGDVRCDVLVPGEGPDGGVVEAEDEGGRDDERRVLTPASLKTLP